VARYRGLVTRQLPSVWQLGEIRDVEAYVRTAVANLGTRAEDVEELVSEGLAHVALEGSVSFLKEPLIDHLRRLHRERQRDGSKLAAIEPLPDDYEPVDAAEPFTDVVERRELMVAFRSEKDLGSPRLTGRFLFGTPSHHPVPTKARREVWAAIEIDREP